MKILIYSLNYAPELTGIGKYSGEMASWLANNGDEVRVVTAPPYYPDWRVPSPYSSSSYHNETLSGVNVFRCPLWVPNNPGGLKRIIHLASFALSSFPIMIRQAFWRPDVVWVVVPAFFTLPAALLTAKLVGAKSWVHIQDFEIDAAFEMGLIKGNLVRKAVLWGESFFLRRFNIVSTISSKMLERLYQKQVSPERALIFPNWVDISAVYPELNGGGYRKEWGIPDQAVIAMYSGNMGGKQGLEILADVAERLKAQTNLYFIFCGKGPAKADLVQRCQSLPNVKFLDLQPLEKLGELLTAADIHLLPQRADAADLVMPSKLTGMLASGRPVIATAHIGTEVESVVKQVGLVVEPENPASFADAINLLLTNKQLRTEFGVKAREFAVNFLEINAVLKKFKKHLHSQQTNE